MKTLIIHCGAHKTATSSLQLLFRQQSDWLLDRGIRYIQPEILNELRVPQHLRGETETVKNGQASGALENLMLTAAGFTMIDSSRNFPNNDYTIDRRLREILWKKRRPEWLAASANLVAQKPG